MSMGAETNENNRRNVESDQKNSVKEGNFDLISYRQSDKSDDDPRN